MLSGSVCSSVTQAEPAPLARSAMSHSVMPISCDTLPAMGPTNSCFSASMEVTARDSGSCSSTSPGGGRVGGGRGARGGGHVGKVGGGVSGGAGGV